MLLSTDHALSFLQSLGASSRLLLHLRLVGEAADELIVGLRGLAVPFDEEFVRLGVAVHDAGKIIHADELDGAGNAHETAGEQLLLAQGVQCNPRSPVAA